MKEKIKALFVKPVVRLACWIAIAATIVAGSLSADFVRQWAASNHFSMFQMRKNAERDIRVNDLLRRTMLDIDADRGWVMMFHNGSATASGIPFKKVSCVYEVVKQGVSTEIHSVQAIPLSSVPEAVELLAKHDDVFEIYTDHLEQSTFRYITEQQGTQYMLWHRVIKDDSIIGIVGFDYLTKPADSLVEKEYGSVNRVAHLIQYELQNN